MELGNAGSLQEILANQQFCSEEFIASVFIQIINGLFYLHQKGFVHHDLKPSNIVLLNDGTAKITDFGVGRSFESVANLFGSAAYQAPEYFDENEDAVVKTEVSKEDIWSLGVSLFQCAFGVLPFEGENIFEIASSIRNNPLSFPFEVSPEFSDLIHRTLVIDPTKRISAADLLQHPFFVKAKKLPLPSRSIPKIDLSCTFINIEAVVCNDEDLKQEVSSSFSWSGLSTESTPLSGSCITDKSKSN